MNKKTLIAGPWVGEFGWELFAWQAYIRSLAEYFDKVVVISREGSRDLYKDFCHQFIPFQPPQELSDSYFMYNVKLEDLLKESISGKYKLTKGCTILKPRRIGKPPFTHYDEIIDIGAYKVKPKYIKFGQKQDTEYDFIFHARNRDLRKEDNWKKENWEKLRNLLNTDKIACIGTKRESLHIEGTEDLRGISLDKLFNVLHNTKCVFGPSSGPMHLSSLCGAPHVVWSKKSNHQRYTSTWNPLSTPVLFDSKYSWHPSPEYVYEVYKNWEIK